VDGSFGEETRLSGNASLTIPLSLSADERDRLTALRSSLAQARMTESEIRAESYILLFSLYKKLWLLQQEAPVLEAESTAAELYAQAMQERFNAGNIPLASLNLAEEAMISRREALGRNRLEQNLTWFELTLNTGIEGPVPRLEAVDMELEELPKPPELEERITTNHPLIEASRRALEILRQNRMRQLEPDLDISIRPFWNYRDHSVSLAYSFADPEISAAYSFPITTWGEIPSGSGSSVETWNTGVSVNISLGSNRYDRLSAEAAGVSIKREEAKLDFLIQSTLLKVRSAYQQLLRSRELLEQAERNRERSATVLRIVEAKRELDQVPRHEALEAAADEARARWRIQEAESAVEKAYLGFLKETGMFAYSPGMTPFLSRTQE
jgi:outer membrane protein TolC